MSERVARWLSSLSAKYIAVFALLVAVPVICTSVYLLYSSYQDNKRALTRLQQEKAKSVSVTIESVLQGSHREDELRCTASYLSFTALGAALHRCSTIRRHRAAFYIDSSGRKTLAKRRRRAHPQSRGTSCTIARVEQAKSSGVYFGPVYAPRLLSNPGARSMEVWSASIPEGYTGQSAGSGVFGETLDLIVIQDLVRRTRLGTSGYVYAVDANGVPIAHPNSAAFTHRSLAFPQVTKALASSSRDRRSAATSAGKRC